MSDREGTYPLTYAITPRLEGVTADFAREHGLGACDAVAIVSINYPDDGGLSVLVASLDGRTRERVTEAELWKVWAMMAKRFARPRTGQARALPDRLRCGAGKSSRRGRTGMTAIVETKPDACTRCGRPLGLPAFRVATDEGERHLVCAPPSAQPLPPFTATDKRTAKALKRAAADECGVTLKHQRCLHLVRQYRAAGAPGRREELVAAILVGEGLDQGRRPTP